MTDRSEWLAERRRGIGASDVAGILGLSPWASPYSVWASKVFEQADDRDTLAMSFGRRAEAMIAPWFHELTGLYVYGQQAQCHHEAWPWQRCTIDGFVYDHPDNHGPDDCPDGCEALGAYEAKTTSATPAEWETDGIPVHYQCQAQWTMHVTGTDHLWFAVLHLAFGRPDLRVYELARDQADIDLIVKTVDAFWHDHVVPGIPPDTDGHTATTYATKHLPASVGDMTELSDDVRAKVKLRDHLKLLIKSGEEQLADVENAIRAALGDCTEGYYDGQLIVSHREQSRNTLDHTALWKDLPDVAAKYMKANSYRVLRTHSPKEGKP
jgi:putative phage-type endonuclease